MTVGHCIVCPRFTASDYPFWYILALLNICNQQSIKDEIHVSIWQLYEMFLG